MKQVGDKIDWQKSYFVLVVKVVESVQDWPVRGMDWRRYAIYYRVLGINNQEYHGWIYKSNVSTEYGVIGAGWSSAKGAMLLNFWNKKQVRESAMVLKWLGKWAWADVLMHNVMSAKSGTAWTARWSIGTTFVDYVSNCKVIWIYEVELAGPFVVPEESRSYDGMYFKENRGS